MNNLAEAFKNKKTFIPFIVCGDPDLDVTGEIILTAVENGADLIELGIPFSDPTAEGPVIQDANIRALAGGVTTDKIFSFVRDIRSKISVPIIFVTYANVIFSYGSERFISACKDSGIEGVIVYDLPYEEKEEFLPVCRKYDVRLISIIAPSTEERIAMIAKEAEGFISISINTDSAKPKSGIITDTNEILSVIKANSSLPCVVYGAENYDIAFSDGFSAGEDIAKLIEKHGKNASKVVGEYICLKKAEINK